MTCVCAISNTSNTTSNTSSPTHHIPHYSYVFSPSSSSSPAPLFLSPRRQQQQHQKKEAPPHRVPTTSVLKKKRPARINIPQVLSFVNANCDGSLVPETSKEEERVDEIESVGEGYAVYSKRGRRRAVLEDRFSAVVSVNRTAHHIHGDMNDGKKSKKALFGVFDGHGGATAAEYAASNLGKNILDRVAVPPCSSSSSDGGTSVDHKYPQASLHAIEDAVREGYLATDEGFLKQDQDGGACGVTALIQDGNLVVSNVGDCRAVLSRGGVAEPLTVDQKASREDERARIEATGGYVDSCNGVWRIQGSLAVSRAIGDRHLKEWVIAEPETRSLLNIQPDCQFLILASDGLWDSVTDQEAVDAVAPFCTAAANEVEGDAGGDRCRNKKPADLSRACRKLVELALRRDSCDDTTVMIIHLGLFANF